MLQSIWRLLLLMELRPWKGQGLVTSEILCRLRASRDEVGRNEMALPWCCVSTTKSTNKYVKRRRYLWLIATHLVLGRAITRIRQVILFGQISRNSTIRSAGFTLQLQQGGFTPVPATPGRKGAAQWSEGNSRQTVPALLISRMSRRRMGCGIASVAFVRVK